MTNLTVTPGDLIALYGTLRLGEPGHALLRLEAALAHRGACTLAGALYDLGDYPGLILEGADPVAADLFEIRDPAIMARLDTHEDFLADDPAGSMYLRDRVRLAQPAAEAWVYVYNRPVDGRTRIEGGDWRAHRAARNP